jgi:chromosome partitioning protein
VRTLAIVNQKGGCGKTTTAVNLSAALAMQGHRVLLIDLDPQGHATLGFGLTPDKMERTIYDVIINPHIGLENILHMTPNPVLWVAPSNVLLSGAESCLVQMIDREYVLRNRLDTVKDKFDWCIIDCAPSLSLLTLNAIGAATDIIIPVQTHYYAIEGLRQMLETYEIVRSRFNPQLRLAGILLTLSEKRTMLSRDVEQQMRDYFKNDVFQTVIHRTVRLAEAPSAGQSVLTYDPQNSGTMEYKALAEELTHETLRITEEHLVHI